MLRITIGGIPDPQKALVILKAIEKALARKTSPKLKPAGKRRRKQ